MPASGRPIVVGDDIGDADVTLIGRGTSDQIHPEHTSRLLGDAMFGGLD